MALLSKSCLYGLRTAIYCAHQSGNGYIPISEIAKELEIPADFLTKILQKLTRKKIMSSLRGVKGGIKLGKSSEKISLYDIVQAIDGETIFRKCFLDLEGCGEETPCPFHESWKSYRTDLGNMLKNTSLSYLIENRKYARLK
ncbi:MAG: Rrf2 family transcriptional regulator [Bacteroidetes bacterium]|nr:MAG: Rrf2 family transcriptional regulator [Bacteroidota bacterium]